MVHKEMYCMSRMDEVAIQCLFMALGNRENQIKLGTLWFEVDGSAYLVRAGITRSSEIRSQNTGISTETSSKIRSDIEFISLPK